MLMCVYCEAQILSNTLTIFTSDIISFEEQYMFSGYTYFQNKQTAPHNT